MPELLKLPKKGLRSRIEALIDRMLSGARRRNVEDALQIASSWMPNGEFYSYREEMTARVRYFLGSMQSDMREVLKRRFPSTYKDLEREQVNLRLIRRMILNKAKVFSNTGSIHLEKDGVMIDPNDPAAITFQQMLDISKHWTFLSSADARTQLCHRCAVKLWWDKRKRGVAASVYSPHLVYLVPDPEREWDADSCWAQLFERPGVEGLTSKPRYEVWGIRDPEAEEITGKNTVHYITDGVNDWKVNEEDVNPFIDPLTGKPMYPMVWWQDDDEAALYVMNDEDLLTMNRMINSGLTDLFQNIHFQAFGIPTYKLPAGGGVEPPAMRILSPKDVVDLPAGVELDFVSPPLNVGEISSFFQLMMKMESLLDGQSPSAVRVEGQLSSSGYALKIENIPLIEHRNSLIPIYKPQVEETIRRMIIIWNTYAEEYGRELIPEDLVPVWTPGDVDYPADKKEMGEVYSQEIASNVSTAVDWRMERYGESRERAEEAVMRNAEFNKQLASVEQVSSPISSAAQVVAERLGLSKPPSPSPVQVEETLIEEAPIPEQE